MNVGIIGLGNIAKRVAKGILYANNATLYAVASRDSEKAIQFQKEFGAEMAYGSYEEFVKDEQLDLVYICTPNALHYEHTMLCLRNKKHVLCEKPFVANQAQLKECFAYAKAQGCFLMEAEKTLFTPLNRELKIRIERGDIGQLRYIEAGYGSDMKLDSLPQDSWLFDKQMGGSLYDVGVYPICYTNYFANAQVKQIQIMKHVDKRAGIDTFAQGMLEYDNGVMAYIRSSWDLDLVNQGYIYGDRGVIICDNFWKGTKAILRKHGIDTVIEVAMDSDFTGEIEHACECIQDGLLESPVLSYRESKEILKVLEEMHKCDCVQ